MEKAEVDAAIRPMLFEAGMLLEAVLLAMLQDEEAAGLQQSAPQDKVGELRQLFQLVRRVGKNQVEAPVRAFEETEYVGMDRQRSRATRHIKEK